ncbi:MAG: hypothetical protein AAB559_01035 [Patescibacteria group bacterium]
MITLKDFIKQSVKDISESKSEEPSIEGVRGVVDFDVATTAVQEGKTGVKISVWGIGGGELGGKLNNQVVSRIQFSIQTKGAIGPGESYRKGPNRAVTYD